MSDRHMIFHIPWEIRQERVSASQIRPLRMLEAFRESGYRVDVVMGNEQEKRAAIDGIKEILHRGRRYDFCYSESSTGPTLIANGWKSLLTYGSSDFSLFRLLKEHCIPIGLFYRDVYWRFREYLTGLPVIKRLLLPVLHIYDLHRYNRLVDLFYLPSLAMGSYVPEFKGRKESLPPGCEIDANRSEAGEDRFRLNLLYVGGLSEHYGIDELMAYARTLSESIQITICTREQDWRERKIYHDLVEQGRIQLAHASGSELTALYRDADVGLLFMEPVPYRSFAMPFKLFEYIGNGIPVIATSGTAAADFILENDAGWVVDYSATALADLVLRLVAKPNEIIEKKQRVMKLRGNQTWGDRVRQVAKDLQFISYKRKDCLREDSYNRH